MARTRSTRLAARPHERLAEILRGSGWRRAALLRRAIAGLLAVLALVLAPIPRARGLRRRPAPRGAAPGPAGGWGPRPGGGGAPGRGGPPRPPGRGGLGGARSARGPPAPPGPPPRVRRGWRRGRRAAPSWGGRAR